MSAVAVAEPTSSESVWQAHDEAPEPHAADLGGGQAVPDALHDPYADPGQSVGEKDNVAVDLARGLQQEGLAGLLDLPGMLDRQRAQQELAGRFQIVGDDRKGRAHNQVTEKEYEELCKTYSDVRMGRGDLTLDAHEIKDPAQAQRYQDAAMGNLADMMMTTSGRKQVMNLSNNVSLGDDGAARLDAAGNPIHHHTTIEPEFKKGATGTSESDYETNKDFTDSANPAERDKRYRGVDGERGEGTDAIVRFSPVAAAKIAPSDVNLAHELQHALHTTQGTVARGDWNGYGRDNPGMFFGGPVPNAERQAVGLDYFGQNVHDPVGCSEDTYRQERNQLGTQDPVPLRHSYRFPGGPFDDDPNP